MGVAPGWYRWVGNDLEVRLRVQPRAHRDEFCEAQGDWLRVRIKAPPVEGKANLALRRFIADAFGVPQSQVEILAGDQSRGKRVLIRAPRRFPMPIAHPVG
jgi:uncharacterized protein (TIGR00251 family)